MKMIVRSIARTWTSASVLAALLVLVTLASVRAESAPSELPHTREYRRTLREALERIPRSEPITRDSDAEILARRIAGGFEPSRATVAELEALLPIVRKLHPDFESIHPRPLGILGDGDDLFAGRSAEGWEFVFSEGSGDCMAGCIWHLSLFVAVDPAGSPLVDPTWPPPDSPGGQAHRSWIPRRILHAQRLPGKL